VSYGGALTVRKDEEALGFGNQVLISSHRKPCAKAVVGGVAGKSREDSGSTGRERRAQANRRREGRGLGVPKPGDDPFLRDELGDA